MNPGDSGEVVPIIPINDYNEMVKAIENIYTHLKTNRAHLYSIENKAEALVRRLEALLPEAPPEPEEVVKEVVEEEPEELTITGNTLLPAGIDGITLDSKEPVDVDAQDPEEDEDENAGRDT